MELAYSFSVEIGVNMRFDQLAQGLHVDPFRILARVVFEAGGHLGGLEVLHVVAQLPFMRGWQNGVVFSEVVGIVRVRFCDHLLVYFLPRADADHRFIAIGTDRFCHIQDAVGGYLGHQDLATPGVFERMQHHIHALFEGDVEPGHIRFGDGQHTCMALLEEERNHRAIGTHHVAIAHHRELDVFEPADVVGGDKQLIRGQLGSPVQVDGCGRFIGGEGHHIFYPCF